MTNRGIIFSIFICTWVAYAIISWRIFSVSKNATLKRNLFPLFNIGNGILFLTFIYLLGFVIYPLIVVGVILIVISNYKQTKFCDSCGITVINYRVFLKP